MSIALLITAAIAVFLMSLMPATMLWDRDETLYARTAVEMLRSGNFLLPTFNGEVFAHKPPLTYWLMAVSFAVFGENEFAARFISAPFMAGAALVTFLIGRRMHSPRAGHWAMIVLATTTLTVFIGSAAMLEAVLLFFICLALFAYVEMVYGGGSTAGMMALFFVALLLAIFVKGPVGPMVVGTTVLASWLSMKRDRRPPFRDMLALAALSFLAFAIFLGWLLPADARSGGEMLRTGVGYHIIERALTPLEGHGGGRTLGWVGTLPYYIPVVLFGFFPWVLFLPAVAVSIKRGELAGRRERAILLGWALPTFAAFTLAATKLPHYLLPIFPALAIAVGIQIAQMAEAGASRGLRVGLWIYGLFAFGFAAALFALPFIQVIDVAAFVSWPLAILAAAVTLLALLTFKAGQVERASLIIAACAPAIFAYLLWVVVPAVEPTIKLSRPLGEAVRMHRGPATDVYMIGFFEPSLVFYASPPLDRPLRGIPENDQGFAALSELDGDFLVVATRRAFDGANALRPEEPLVEIASFSAWNTNGGIRFQEVLLARRAAYTGNAAAPQLAR